MKFKIFILFLLLPAVLLAQTPVPTAKAAVSKTPYRAKIFVKKKSDVSPKRTVPPATNLSETQSQPLDRNYYDRLNNFFSSNYSMGKNPQPSADPLWGIVGGMASGVCAGVAAVQWLEAQGKKNQKAETKPSDSTAKAKTI